MPRRAASASHLPGHPGVEEKGRGEETRPLWLALLLEPLRLRLDRNPRGGGSPTRQRSYRARGRYARQLANLYRHFARERVLVLRQTDLLDDHDGALRRVFAFLGVDPDIGVPPARVLVGAPRPRRWLVLALLRLSFVADAVRLRRLGQRL